MKLLVDNNLPAALARALNELFAGEHEIIHIRDKFGTGSLSDKDWINRLVGDGKWCVLSGDRNIALKRPSREIFLQAKLVGFFPRPDVMKLPTHRKAARILVLWDRLISLDRSTENGCFELGIKGIRLNQIRG